MSYAGILFCNQSQVEPKVCNVQILKINQIFIREICQKNFLVRFK